MLKTFAVTAILLFLVGSAFAGASFTVYEADLTSQNGRAVWKGQWFADGEIANCPQATISGQSVVKWQATVLNRWASGKVKFAIVALEVPTLGSNGNAIVTFSNTSGTTSCSSTGSGLTYAQMKNFDTGGGAGSYNCQVVVTPASGSNGAAATTIDCKTMLNGVDPTIHTIADGTNFVRASGPVMTQVVLQDHTTATANAIGWHWNNTNMVSNGTASYTGNCSNASPCYASLDPTMVLTYFPDASNIQEDFWLENMMSSRLQDQKISFVIKTGTSPTTVYSSTSVVDNASGIFTMIGGTPWRKTFWGGTAPGHVRTDNNFAYLIGASAFPCYDNVAADGVCHNTGLTVTIDPTQTATNWESPRWNVWTGTDHGEINGDGLASQWDNTATPKSYDQNWEGSLLSTEDLTLLYNTDCGTANGKCAKAYQMLCGRTSCDGDSLTKAALDTGTSVTQYDVPGYAGMWNVLSNVPYHMRESRDDSTKFYCGAMADKNAKVDSSGTPSTCLSGASTEIAFGRGLSRHAHNSDTYALPGTAPLANIGTLTQNGWVLPNTAHWLDYSYAAYIETGDYYFYDEAMQGASWILDNVNTAYYASNFQFAYIAPSSGGARAWGWGINSLGHAAAIAVDGTVEQTYYTAQLTSNLEVMEGVLGVTGTSLTPTVADSSGFATNTQCKTFDGIAAINRWNQGWCVRANLCIYNPTNPCSANADNTIGGNPQHNLVPGECINFGLTQLHQAQITSCTNANPAVCTFTPSTTFSQNTVTVSGVTGTWASHLNQTIIAAGFPSGTTITMPFSGVGLGSITGTVLINDGSINPANSTDFVQDWMMWGALGGLGHLNEIGLTQAAGTLNEAGKRLVEELQDPGYNPRAVGLYVSPGRYSTPDTCSGSAETGRNFAYPDWTAAGSGLTPDYIVLTGFLTQDGQNPCDPSGYSSQARSAISFLTALNYSCPTSGTCSGQSAWNYLGVNGYTGADGGAVPYFNNKAFQDDAAGASPGCSAANIGNQIKGAIVPRNSDVPTITSCDSMSPTTPTIAILGTQDFTASCTDSDMNTVNCTASLSLSSGTPSVATVLGQTATGVSGGSSIISGTVDGHACGNTSALTVSAAASGSFRAPGTMAMANTIQK